MKSFAVFAALLALAACAPPIPPQPVPPHFNIAPARNVAIIGDSEQTPDDDGAEEAFLNLVIAKLRANGGLEIKDQRALMRQTHDLQAVLAQTDADVVARISPPTDDCWLYTKVLQEAGTDANGNDTDELDAYIGECMASVYLYRGRTGQSLGYFRSDGYGYDGDQNVAWNRAKSEAALQLVSTFAPLPGTDLSIDPDADDPAKRAAAKERAAAAIKAAYNASGISYVLIPAGTFSMGCTDRDIDCKEEEKPSHDVTISKAFYLAFSPTTNFQYQQCVDAGGCHGTADAQKRLNPVVNVDWDEARAFCTWAGGRLPTEAEFEYAARGGVAGWKFPWGNAAGSGNANFADNNGVRVEALGLYETPAKVTYAFSGTSPIGTFDPNGFGLHDMTGNVSEWTADWMGPYTAAAATDPVGPATGDHRVVRGGSWAVTPIGGRLSVRYAALPEFSQNTLGFRCAMDFQSP